MPAIIGAILEIVAIYAALLLVFDPKGTDKVANLLGNVVEGGLKIATPLVDKVGDKLGPVVTAFVNAFDKHGGGIKAQLTAPIAKFARGAFNTVKKPMEGRGVITPGMWEEVAGDVMAEAFGFGLASFGVSAAFESAFPEKLNTLNGMGPMLATLAGFGEVTDAALGPLLQAAIKRPAQFDANAKTRSNLPGEMSVAILYSRGIIGKELAQLFLKYRGYTDPDIESILQSSFRPLSPFVIRGGMSTGILSDAEMRDAMTYMGLRPGDQDKMIEIGKALALQRYQDSYVAAAQSGFAKGIVGDDEFREVLADAKYTPEKAALATWTALLKRREVFATEVETQVVGLVAAGLMTPDEGLSQLEASGVQEWQARTKITLATTKAQLTAARIEAAAERRAALQEQRNLTRVAIDQYKVGTIDEVGLTAALIAIGLSASLVASTVSMASAERTGRMTFAFGLVLPRQDAEVLRQQVNAIEAQMKKQLITIDTARASLTGLKIPAEEIDALIARWAAGIAKPTTTGVLAG